MTHPTLKAIRERIEKATAAGCLPSDNCCFSYPEQKCIFCGREAGHSPPNTYAVSWGAKDDAIEDAKRTLSALEVAMGALEQVMRLGTHQDGNTMECEAAYRSLAEINRILEGK